MESMNELKKRHQDEVNNFEGLFFAFSDKQLREGLVRVGLEETDVKKIVSIGAGGFLRKDVSDSFRDMFIRHTKEAKECRKANKQIKIKYVGVDYWGKANFRTIEKPYRFYGSVHVLFSDDAPESEVLAEIDEDSMCYFGRSFGCEPEGTLTGNIKIVKQSLATV